MKDKGDVIKKETDEFLRTKKLFEDLAEKMLELNLIIAPLLKGTYHRTDLERLDTNIKELSAILAEILRAPYSK